MNHVLPDVKAIGTTQTIADHSYSVSITPEGSGNPSVSLDATALTALETAAKNILSATNTTVTNATVKSLQISCNVLPN